MQELVIVCEDSEMVEGGLIGDDDKMDLAPLSLISN